MRRPLIAGNWKMYKDHREATDLVNNLWPLVKDNRDVEVVVCPSFTSLYPVSELIRDKGYGIALGAQDVFYENEGAYTGEVSPGMLKALDVSYVILGHSERRQIFGEDDDLVSRKLRAALEWGFNAILCVGETLKEREDGKTLAKILGQVKRDLQGVSAENLERTVIAYEPIWAIGTGRNASPQDAEEAIASIREEIANLYGKGNSERIRILYGGSVKPDNIRSLMEMPDIDGALVGGASLDARDFAAIVNYML